MAIRARKMRLKTSGPINDALSQIELTNVPQEFADFIKLFTLDYESTRDQLKNANGNPLSLEDYLTTVLQYGEFDNTEEKPILQFISNILDITIIKPLIKAVLGYDLITQRELSDLERGLKAGCALIDAVTMLVGIKASGVVSLFSKEALEAAGKTMAIDLVANTAAYGVEKLGEELGLPWPVTMLLSLGAGMTVSISGSKYVFENSAGTMKFEADISEVKALLEKQGITNVDEVIERLAKGVTAVSEGGKYSLSNVEARKWYLEHEAQIPDMIDSSLPLEEQAKQAFNLRNQFRTEARELMADRAMAESLYKTDKNLT